jgi:hypothetical protein
METGLSGQSTLGSRDVAQPIGMLSVSRIPQCKDPPNEARQSEQAADALNKRCSLIVRDE